MKNIFLSLLVILGMTSCNSGQKTITSNSDNEIPSVVDENGSLSVKGNQIVNKDGNAVSFAGNSFFWSNQGWSGAKFYNKDIVKWLVDDWGATIVRCPLASDKKVKNGYHEEPEQNIKRVSYVVDEAIKQGIYVIIDWHSHKAEFNKKLAIEFFKKMATKYGNNPNVIYEIYNEPLQVSWDDVIKPYAEEVIAEIRKIDPNNLIVVGTPNWSQDVDIASENPITGYKNIAYTLHFYAGSHKQSLRDKAEKALNNGIAIMVT
ncbi:MAG: glycoside hydrolase family 5 protein, partial [Bacteroidales bacterium]|nr:glycoside hydrolase family 5 protein [Bacteroidales bacterium]